MVTALPSVTGSPILEPEKPRPSSPVRGFSMRRWSRFKKKKSPGTVFPPSEASPCASTHARIVSTRLDSHCVQKKEISESADPRNEEAPHGGSGASRVPWGGTSDGEGAPSHYLLTAFSGSLCQAFCLIEGKKSRRE